MDPIPYIMGETRTAGIPIDQIDGTPMPLDGLAMRLLIDLGDGTEMIIPMWADSGEVMTTTGQIVDHPSIAAFQMSPANTPPLPDLYRCLLQVDNGKGFKTLADGDHLFHVRTV